MSQGRIVVGVDNGGTSNNVTVLSDGGRFLVESMLEVPSRVLDGPEPAIAAMVEAFHLGLQHTGCALADVVAVGLDTPGPASAEGVLSSRGAANFSDRAWWSFDIRGALQEALQLPVVYSNDGNAAALYAHHAHFGQMALDRSSVSAIVGTGLGGGVIEGGRIIRGAAGMAGELGHVHIPMDGVLEPDQPAPRCNCGFVNDVESVASLTAIRQNLLPYWLDRYPDHPLHGVDPTVASKQVRGLAEQGDELALRVFGQQAAALGNLFTIASNFTDPHAYFVGGGVVEASPAFRDWFLGEIRRNTTLRDEQQRIVEFAVVPDRDMAGARGAALAAMGRFG